MPGTLSAAAVAVLTTAAPTDKVALTRRFAADWSAGRITALGDTAPPDRPARPERPELRLPRDMPKRGRGGSAQNRIALLHALAHIELNAIDLAWDLCARFAGAALPRGFFDDWVRVADDEARHFDLLERRMNALGAAYGDLPAHDGLWQSAQATAHDLAARLAVVPMVLEARGLDVTPDTVARLRGFGDAESAGILRLIHDDEIVHVAAGRRWFEHVCGERGAEPVALWQELVRRYFRGQVKRPFNIDGRLRAGFGPEFYEPLAAD
ncbi:ferritin-like domain-containing protein [Azospirillum sp. RWY-5-1]|uniref:Ferritin-like domain-containing protein n=1 Tax=Azospirillum oleiclasticum TaxID=2735135 RepID=A0ABX2T3R0_9PROT|nr:ferritin-like domain-containing protein [Azospirillum oleiclasticum]NYZ11556.1 ferritin-like domain-containing protein [Azospirillum oleiclasticum]NYZ18717.1 ferritin-like domain-containing protein [Azospirillum oleiclasticum]